ncbi:helix-turn-helix domain-containing protein [Kitasatospora sp. NPDC059146]|uniref:helix-turn-helix domain-containing protein n=1 Tax=Kitasatospora sp. NPDC059146 TaxID=3346741 RepID=UPI0036CF9A98
MRTSRSSSVQQARKALADRLREIRQDAHLTGPALALLCGWSKSKCSRIENAITAPSEKDIRDWCHACNADGQAEDLAASLRTVETMFTEWRRMERSGLKRAQEMVLPLYERTTRFRAYTPGILHGLLQTRDYTRSVPQATQRRRVAVNDVEEAVQVRMERQAILRDHGRTFAFIIEEACLHHGLGGPEVAAGQLAHLNIVASLANVSLGIVPRGLLRHSMQVEAFSIYDSAQVNVELVSGYLQITQPSEVGMYVSRFGELSTDAVHGAAARALISGALDSLG